MTDHELDELLDTWAVPPPSTALRQSVSARLAQPIRITVRSPRRKKRMFLVAAALGAAVLLIVVAQARPGSPPVSIPFTADSEFLRYAADGTSSVEMLLTSYEFNGNEVLTWRSIPGHPMGTALGRMLDAALPLWSQFISRITVDAGTLEKVRRSARSSLGMIAGCNASCLALRHYAFQRAAAADAPCIAGAVIDRQTILGYAAAAVRPQWGSNERMTVWTTPALGCFALRITTEAKRPNGAWQVLEEKRALRVHLRP